MGQIKSKITLLIIGTVFAATLSCCGGDEPEDMNRGIIVESVDVENTERTTERNTVTETEGEMIGEADLIIPDTQEELEAYIKEVKGE